MDDDFLTKCFEKDTVCTQLVLRIILNKPDLVVLDVRTQVFVANLLKRSVKLDIVATDSEGRRINVEVQREDRGAGRRRARYNASMMDSSSLEKGTDFEELPEVYVIFITENDVMGKNQPLYQVERCILETGERFDDGSHILYVNGAYRDETPLGKLMHDFACPEPEKMYYDELSQRVRFFKESKEGVTTMCKAMEDMREKSLKEGERKNMIDTAKRMLLLGRYALEEIADISGLPLEEVLQLKQA
ncbi:MAG: nuclease [Angelakisella sp.]|nr:nuclease [Angelakisella sp.]